MQSVLLTNVHLSLASPVLVLLTGWVQSPGSDQSRPLSSNRPGLGRGPPPGRRPSRRTPPTHEIQQQGLAPRSSRAGGVEGGDEGPPRRVLQGSEPRAVQDVGYLPDPIDDGAVHTARAGGTDPRTGRLRLPRLSQPWRFN